MTHGTMTRQLSLLQGRSAVATPIKQEGLRGIYATLALRRKKWRGHVLFADLYSGSGTNSLDGQEINGSPLSMLAGIHDSVIRMKGPPSGKWVIAFNDIAPGRASGLLPNNVMRWQEENGLAINPEQLVCYTKDGYRVEIPIHYREGCAQSLTAEITDLLKDYTDALATITIDPNGPKDAPWEEVRFLWSRFHKRVDLIFHISATTMKRVAKARASVAFEFAPMPDHIDALLSAFRQCSGWVRAPVGADQWTLLWVTEFEPRNGWNRRDAPFFPIRSTGGQDAIQRMSMTRKELGASA